MGQGSEHPCVSLITYNLATSKFFSSQVLALGCTPRKMRFAGHLSCGGAKDHHSNRITRNAKSTQFIFCSRYQNVLGPKRVKGVHCMFAEAGI